MTPTGSKRKAAKSPRFVGHEDSPLAPLDLLAPPDLAPSMAAAHYVAEHGCSYTAAADRYGVTKQAVADAFRRAFTLPPRKVGRPRSAQPRTHTISVAPGVNLRASDVELAAYRKAAGARSIASWIREMCGPRWRVAGAPKMRMRARAAAGLPEE